MKVGAVFFDLDETLFDRRGSLRDFLRDQYRRYRVLHAIDTDHFIARFLELDARGLTAKSIVYSRMLEEIGHNDPALAIELLHDYETNAQRFARPFKCTDRTLATLRSRDVRLGIVSNGQTHIQQATIETLELERKVDTILISQAEGVRKPNAEIFMRAAARLGTEPFRCLFVGDNPRADILGADAVGMATAWIPNGVAWPSDAPANPGSTMGSLAQVLELVETAF